MGRALGDHELQAFRHRGGFGGKLALVPQGVRAPFCVDMNFPLRTRCHFAVTVAIRINCYNFYIDQSRGNRIASLPRVNGIGI
jgi:hypothetical protein